MINKEVEEISVRKPFKNIDYKEEERNRMLSRERVTLKNAGGRIGSYIDYSQPCFLSCYNLPSPICQR